MEMKEALLVSGRAHLSNNAPQFCCFLHQATKGRLGVFVKETPGSSVPLPVGEAGKIVSVVKEEESRLFKSLFSFCCRRPLSSHLEKERIYFSIQMRL